MVASERIALVGGPGDGLVIEWGGGDMLEWKPTDDRERIVARTQGRPAKDGDPIQYRRSRRTSHLFVYYIGACKMPTVMKQFGDAFGRPLPNDGQYLKDFDFEAHDGRGSITLTPNLDEAMIFPDLAAAMSFYRRSPACRPQRPDGRPNRPLTAANWEFSAVEEDING